jgi:hypothetical protein
VGSRLLKLGVAAFAAVVLFALTAPLAVAATWQVSKPGPNHIPCGHIESTGGKVFVVTDEDWIKVGKVAKTSTGAWRIVRNGKRIAVVKRGTRRHPAYLYDRNGARSGRCDPSGGNWKLIHIIDYGQGDGMLANVAKAPRACPPQAALGAARLLAWD